MLRGLFGVIHLSEKRLLVQWPDPTSFPNHLSDMRLIGQVTPILSTGIRRPEQSTVSWDAEARLGGTAGAAKDRQLANQ